MSALRYMIATAFFLAGILLAMALERHNPYWTVAAIASLPVTLIFHGWYWRDDIRWTKTNDRS